ncbi:TRAP transporter substrate-binding protein [Muricoccus radiodurans]|uniref:TRAP transporter substrate-binding protein n=1 Tax=Muricoccus radiodurans TaxID=2231721 RepID=UPI003CF42A27
MPEPGPEPNSSRRYIRQTAWRSLGRSVALLLITVLAFHPVRPRAEADIRIAVVGGLAGVGQFTRLEEPFWTQTVPRLTNGRVQAEIHAFDRSGFRGQEMLQLMRLGVVPFGTALLAVVSSEDPELNAIDLPALSPDMPTLRQIVERYRPHLKRILRERYDIELLAVYAYPAQVLFCTRPFTGLQDMAGRRVRTSSVGQSNLLSAVGATPVIIPFASIVSSVRSNLIDCAVTGTQSGIEIGLSDVTTHIHTMALSWGLSFFGATVGAWESLPEDVRTSIGQGVSQLERDIWDAAARETAEGIACSTGAPSCQGRRGRMVAVEGRPSEEALRRSLLTGTVLPDWIRRCGAGCTTAWNQTLGPMLGIEAPAP